MEIQFKNYIHKHLIKIMTLEYITHVTVDIKYTIPDKCLILKSSFKTARLRWIPH